VLYHLLKKEPTAELYLFGSIFSCHYYMKIIEKPLRGVFVRQLHKISSIQCCSSLVGKNGPGWELNPRPQLNRSLLPKQFIANLKGQLRKENIIVQIPPAPLFFFFLKLSVALYHQAKSSKERASQGNKNKKVYYRAILCVWQERSLNYYNRIT
jgi:hypothetical protein